MGNLGQLCNFEYLDHTADIMFVWGKDLKESFEQMALAMMHYMVELDTVEMDDSAVTHEIKVSGHDMDSLLFAYMDECLFIFNTEFSIFKEIEILSIDRESFTIEARAKGIELDKSKHTTGTEIKAITYSCMEIKEAQDKSEVYLIVDI
ncbi:hypothetical protein CYY_004256 [Polysphondylium violaceum]|uniref:Protein archease-like n=1 Tax=Polysphondylium violaceum TaxID=133409 RepID=A0A8J4PUW3_9MYCE|nr:hypothetical protein CYY_004256 [Polysphondylium violaceum]